MIGGKRDFWSLVEQTAGCWLWVGYTKRDGYGQYLGRPAHRVAYELVVGPIPPGLQIDHLCNNAPCVRPEHLEAVTPQENNRRRDNGGTHCKSGHPYDEANTYIRPNGCRDCRACIRMRARAYYRRKRAA
jgi:HNH endonuclease